MSFAPAATIWTHLRAAALAAVVPAALAVTAPMPAAAQDASVYEVQVSDVTAKVGEPAVLHATLKVRDGYRILKSYNNRVGRLSSFDDGVAFDAEMVKPQLEDGAMVFDIPLRATKPGKHAINGVFRVGYIVGSEEMDMVSVKLIDNVTGTD